MSEEDDVKTRKKRQERLGNVLFGVTLLGVGAYLLIVPFPGFADHSGFLTSLILIVVLSSTLFLVFKRKEWL